MNIEEEMDASANEILYLNKLFNLGLCVALSPSKYICSLREGHEGEHEAHANVGVVQKW